PRGFAPRASLFPYTTLVRSIRTVYASWMRDPLHYCNLTYRSYYGNINICTGQKGNGDIHRDHRPDVLCFWICVVGERDIDPLLSDRVRTDEFSVVSGGFCVLYLLPCHVHALFLPAEACRVQKGDRDRFLDHGLGSTAVCSGCIWAYVHDFFGRAFYPGNRAGGASDGGQPLHYPNR